MGTNQDEDKDEGQEDEAIKALSSGSCSKSSEEASRSVGDRVDSHIRTWKGEYSQDARNEERGTEEEGGGGGERREATVHC